MRESKNAYKNDELFEYVSKLEADSSGESAKEAYTELIKAAEKGNTEAMFWLGVICEEKKEYFSPEDGFCWFLKAAEAGNLSAQFQVGYHYLHGVSVGRDYHKAYYWFRISAEQGYPHSQNSLGTMYLRNQVDCEDDKELYEYGDGKRLEKGYLWLTESAKQRHHAGLYNLAGMFLHGVYVEKNAEMAISLYRLGLEAKGSDTRCRKILEYLHASEKITEQDNTMIEQLFNEQ